MSARAGVEGSLASGREALLRAAWAEARAHFDAALAAGETIDALEGLGAAARWQMDGVAAFVCGHDAEASPRLRLVAR